MKYFSYLVVAAMIFDATLISSCNKSDDNPKVWLLESIILSEHDALSDNVYQITHEYEYDSRNRVTERTDDESGIVTLSYNAAGGLVEFSNEYRMSRSPWSKTTFSQNDNKITFITRNYHQLGQRSGNVNGKLELNVQGLPVKLTSEFVGNSIHGRVTDNWSDSIVLKWQNGNLIKIDWEREWKRESIVLAPDEWQIDRIDREEGTNAGTVTFTFDNKKTPFYHCNTPKWFLWWYNYCSWNGFNENNWGGNYGYNKNNVKTETSETGNTTTYEYMYNDDGFPVTRTWGKASMWVDGTTTETYTYK